MKLKINAEVVIENIPEKLYKDFEDIDIEETELSTFFGIIVC